MSWIIYVVCGLLIGIGYNTIKNHSDNNIPYLHYSKQNKIFVQLGVLGFICGLLIIFIDYSRVLSPFDIEDCNGKEINCWNNSINLLLESMVEDLDDGVLDDEYYWSYKGDTRNGWIDIKSRLKTIQENNIGGEMFVYDIMENFRKKLFEIEPVQRNIILRSLNMELR